MSTFDGFIKDDILEVQQWQHGNAPWFQRGWTFQESYFSKRKLLIGDDMAYMWYEGRIESMDGMWYRSEDGAQLTLDASKSSRQNLMDLWYSMVGFYVRRRLSYERDRLPALSGVARALAKSFPDLKYLAGLWKADLHKWLLWMPETTQNYDDYIKQRQHEYIAPSWSWASRPGPVSWFLTPPRFRDECPEFELRVANVVTDEFHPFGRVLSANLELSAKMYKLVPPEEEGENSSKKSHHIERASFMDMERLDYYHFQYTLHSKYGGYVASLKFDWYEQRKLHDGYGFPYALIDKMRMLLISHFDISDGVLRLDSLADQKVMAGLLVVPTQNAEEFVRVGMWYSFAKGLGGGRFWEEVQPQIMRLV
ncbi:hypothetical protein TGAMA5MH_07945 [Trichoderma gamsii]|uniref:Heterokaryon incompatibility domain-containing protein n=1 Tax=Trichoderma gamsii TaxID=398673 RepID=A0A2K0T3C3_9HYPO|nr:hypothetical protein TGAMA5MH_07945 [Trichoderma gamsii]